MYLVSAPSLLGGEAETRYVYVLASSSPSLLGAEEEEASVRAHAYVRGSASLLGLPLATA